VTAPRDVRDSVRREVWQRAAALDWPHLATPDRNRYYAQWTEDDAIGNVLSGYIDKGRVHGYLKDTLMKGYARQQQSDDAVAKRVLGIPPDVATVRAYTRPHGCQFEDGRLICWGRASAWKLVIMALYERAYESDHARPHGVVLSHAAGRYSEAHFQGKVENAATRLGIGLVRWQ